MRDARRLPAASLRPIWRALVALPLPSSPLRGRDLAGAAGVFGLVVLAILPVVLVFVFARDVALAMYASTSSGPQPSSAAGVVLLKVLDHLATTRLSRLAVPGLYRLVARWGDRLTAAAWQRKPRARASHWSAAPRNDRTAPAQAR